eukprot:4160819-Ditylum_brightwellii.AAC.1
MCRVGSFLNYMGQQDAAQKTRPPMTGQKGAWAGRLFRVKPGQGAYVITSQEKLNKFKTIVNEWLSTIDECQEKKVPV